MEGWRVAPEARESGVGRAAAAVGQRARTTGFTPISRCGHLALSSRFGLDVVREADHHHYPHRSFSQVSRTRDSAGGSRRYAAPEMHTHTARHRLGWWFARVTEEGEK